MIETVLTALLLGVLTGVVPGPYTTALAATAVEKGLRPALPLVFVPLVSDVPPMLATALVLDRVSGRVLTAVGVLGGVVLAWLGVRFLRRNGEGWSGPSGGGEDAQSARFGHLAAAGLLSPAPWLFWLVAASPLLLRAWHRSPVQGIVFAAVLFGAILATGAGVAWAACHGRRLLDVAWRRRVLRGIGAALIVAGGVLVWQSVEGNFQSMVQRQEAVREAVD